MKTDGKLEEFEVEELAREKGVMFARRSYGKTTTTTVTLDAITQIVNAAIEKKKLFAVDESHTYFSAKKKDV